ncbi:homeobox protein cut-like, partial [Caerostris extrusa]
EKAEEKDPEFVHLFDEKESDQLGSEFAVKSNLEEAETKVAQLQSGKSDEMEVIVNDLERANQGSCRLTFASRLQQAERDDIPVYTFAVTGTTGKHLIGHHLSSFERSILGSETLGIIQPLILIYKN